MHSSIPVLLERIQTGWFRSACDRRLSPPRRQRNLLLALLDAIPPRPLHFSIHSLKDLFSDFQK